MDVSVGPRWQAFVSDAVARGRFNSPQEMVDEGLRLVAEREKELDGLRSKLKQAIDAGGNISDEDLAAALDAKEEELRQQGF